MTYVREGRNGPVFPVSRWIWGERLVVLDKKGNEHIIWPNMEFFYNPCDAQGNIYGKEVKK